jgi:hypothetical protein
MAYWPGRALTPDTRTVTFSLAVDATTRENGALKFWTGSGDAGVLHPHKPLAASGSRDEAHGVAVEVDEERLPIETLTVNRGDVTIHDEWVVHGRCVFCGRRGLLCSRVRRLRSQFLPPLYLPPPPLPYVQWREPQQGHAQDLRPGLSHRRDGGQGARGRL